MTDPLAFASTTPRLSLPLLHVGQAQKEVTVNEAVLRADALLHAVVQGAADSPPTSPAEGDSWIVGSAATGEWAGHAGDLAHFAGGAWLFTSPREGMAVFDASADQTTRYSNGWQYASAPVQPAGGITVDTEARDAIAGLVAALVSVGVLPDS